MGGVVGLATATFRHDSAPILQHVELTSMVADGKELPPYFDSAYGCDMEVLQFDSRRPAPRYEDGVSELPEALRTAPVICRERPRAVRQSVRAGLELARELGMAAAW